jgi:tryptophanyl-tRNA synthetase
LGFASPQDAGRAIGLLREQRGAALTLLAAQLEPIDNANMRAATDALEALAAENSADKSD